VKRVDLRKLALVALVLLMVASVAACGPAEETPAEPEAGETETETQPEETEGTLKTLVIGKAQDPSSLDPAFTSTNNDWTITYPAYERLLQYKIENGVGTTELEGELASSWEVSEDGLAWTFYLEEGHKFADGTPVDAAAVKYSFDRLMGMGKGPSSVFTSLESVTVEDDYTVKFTLAESFPPFLSALTTNGASIVNPTVADHEVDGDYGEGWLSENTAGSGAYQLIEWAKGQYLRMEPNPHYAGPEPFFDTVVCKIIKEASARRLQLEKGDIDIAESIPLDQLEELKKKEGIKVEDYPSLAVTYLYMMNEKAPLDDVRVRKALSYAVDYQAIIDGILLGQAKQMRGPVPEGMWGQDESLFQFTHDVDKAKSLLAEAGVEEGTTLGYLYAESDPNWEPIGLAVQGNMSDVGISIKMQKYAYATMRDRLDRGEFDLAAGNWTPDFADPYMFMNYWFDSNNHGLPGNRSFYTNETVDSLIREAATVNDMDERVRLYKEAQQLIVEDAAYIYLFQRNYQLAMREEVKGYVYNPMLLDIYNIGTMTKEQ